VPGFNDGHVLATSIGGARHQFVIMFFRNGLLSLPKADLGFVFVVHTLRASSPTPDFRRWRGTHPARRRDWLAAPVRNRSHPLSRLPLIPNQDIPPSLEYRPCWLAVRFRLAT
jgi:hypothetical protein